jgi:hypothetical protein
MGAVIMELHSNWKGVVLTKLQWNAMYIQWVATQATCLLTFIAYKYSDLQVSSTTQKLNCKANCKTPNFL